VLPAASNFALQIGVEPSQHSPRKQQQQTVAVVSRLWLALQEESCPVSCGGGVGRAGESYSSREFEGGSRGKYCGGCTGNRRRPRRHPEIHPFALATRTIVKELMDQKEVN